MKQFLALIAVAALTSSPLMAVQHNFQSQKVTFDQLPAGAKAAVKAQAGNAPIQDIDMETFDGFTTYQVAFNKGGAHRELRVDANGKTWGKQWREIPAAVEKAADQRIGNDKFLGFRKHAVNGQPVYHFRYEKNGSPAELWLSQNGTMVKRPAGIDITESAGANATTAGQILPTPSATPITAPGAQAGGNWVQFKDLSWPVQQTIMNQAGGANVQRVYKTEREGKTVYHARFDKDGQRTRLAVGQDGTVINTTTGAAAGFDPADTGNTTTQLSGGTKVSFNDLPQAVKNSINAQANGAAIEDIDKGTINGQTVYEAAFKKQGRTYELQVKEDGSVLGGHFD